MNFTFLDLARDVVGLAAGGVIGLAFGTLQQAALRHNEQLAQSGQVKNAWSLMPKAGARVSYLLLTLVLIQFVWLGLRSITGVRRTHGSPFICGGSGADSHSITLLSTDAAPFVSTAFTAKNQRPRNGTATVCVRTKPTFVTYDSAAAFVP